MLWDSALQLSSIVDPLFRAKGRRRKAEVEKTKSRRREEDHDEVVNAQTQAFGSDAVENLNVAGAALSKIRGENESVAAAQQRALITDMAYFQPRVSGGSTRSQKEYLAISNLDRRVRIFDISASHGAAIRGKSDIARRHREAEGHTTRLSLCEYNVLVGDFTTLELPQTICSVDCGHIRSSWNHMLLVGDQGGVVEGRRPDSNGRGRTDRSVTYTSVGKYLAHSAAVKRIRYFSDLGILSSGMDGALVLSNPERFQQVRSITAASNVRARKGSGNESGLDQNPLGTHGFLGKSIFLGLQRYSKYNSVISGNSKARAKIGQFDPYLQDEEERHRGIYAFCWSSQNHFIASAGFDRQVSIWDRHLRSKPVSVLDGGHGTHGHKDLIVDVVCNDRFHQIITASLDRKICVLMQHIFGLSTVIFCSVSF